MDIVKPKAPKTSVLIVDDDEGIRSVLETRLFAEGYDVHVAANGKHALQKLGAGRTFDLILCDLRMPVMDGGTFISQLRKMGVTAPIIVISSEVDSNIIKALSAYKLFAFCLKPFKYADLYTRIRTVLGDKALPETTAMKS